MMKETKVGKKLSDLTIRRVIILVLAMLISVPVFTDLTYLDDNTSFEIPLRILSAFNVHTDEFNLMF